jgi:competence protein ComEA
MTENGLVRARWKVAVLAAVFGLALAAWAQTLPAALAAKPNSQSIPPPEDRIDINHASEAELLKVPGMTSSWAGRIVRFRPYRTKADLVERGVLPGDVYDRIKDYVIAHRDKH